MYMCAHKISTTYVDFHFLIYVCVYIYIHVCIAYIELQIAFLKKDFF